MTGVIKYFEVKIVSSFKDDVWYHDYIGETISVTEPYKHSWGYLTKGGLQIYKGDVEMVKK